MPRFVRYGFSCVYCISVELPAGREAAKTYSTSDYAQSGFVRILHGSGTFASMTTSVGR